MGSRALWKGWLKVAELSCPVALLGAVAASDRIVLHNVSRASGARLRREFFDAETGEEVPREDQVKGYETESGEFVEFEPEEIAALVPDSDKTLCADRFVPLAEVDPLFLDRPYFLVPGDSAGMEVYGLVRDALAAEKAAALAQAVLFRRLRHVLIRAEGAGLIATTLAFDHEVRPPAEAFAGLPKVKVSAEMLDLAKHIIAGKAGVFDPAAIEDRYEAALADLVKAKIAGRRPPRPRAPKREKVVDLMEALRASVGASKAPRRRARAPTRKAG